MRFIVQRDHFLVTTTDEGSETILGQGRVLSPTQIFDIEFPYLLVPQVSHYYINDMLTHLEIPEAFIEQLKRQISIHAYQEALICRETRSQSLSIIIGLNIHLVEELAELEASLMDMVGDGGFRLVPASRSSIEALQIKKFDDTEDPSSSTETCMICMDEYVKGIDLAWMPCSHFFHSECLVTWLEQKNSCPLCRFELPTET
ncbi:E3 ubiquitin ligase BIG BROTHER-related-like [Macadamia integrifolia]|uniref:E3 ubiquitin ligase BIG BROTHER-related-like n=1 Tax=Macadamia integrifolia TaxID=60698 RepID=UPI001C501A3F|nr:E3 ubiquitin ligase BIG BROTHER-related-like [Macadamia integrifolia]